MADYAVNSYENISVVSDITTKYVFLPDSVVNTSSFDDINVIATILLTGFENSSSLEQVKITVGIKAEDVQNSSAVSNLFRVSPGGVTASIGSALNTSEVESVPKTDFTIKVLSISNQSVVDDVVIPTEGLSSVNSLVNQSPFGLIIAKAQNPLVDVVVPTNPVTRPTTNIVPFSEGLIDGNNLERYPYKDLSNSFVAHPLTGNVTKVVGVAAINQSLRNLIHTEPNERFFDNIDLGSRIRSRLFDLFTPTIKREIEEDIALAILNYEPRIIIVDIAVEDKPEQHRLNISIYYKIRTQNKVEEFSTFIERI